MKTITETELQSLLTDYSGFVSITTTTSPKLNKKHRETKAVCPFTNVVRTAVRLGLVGASYENAVNNRREAEEHPQAGEFKAESLWNGAGEHVSKSLCRHKGTGKVYMVFYPRKDSVLEDVWTADGEKVDVSALAPYLPPVSEGSKRQECETPVPWRTIGLDSIVSVTLRGETFVVVH